MRAVSFGVALLVGSWIGGDAMALEGCKTVSMSCSAMYANCQKVCGREPNPSRCMAASCEVNMPQCQGTGYWRARNGSNACWQTSNRS